MNPFNTDSEAPLPMAPSGQKSLAPRTIKEEMEYRKMVLTEQLRDVDRAIDLLDQHPEVQEIIDALKKVGRY